MYKFKNLQNSPVEVRTNKGIVTAGPKSTISVEDFETGFKDVYEAWPFCELTGGPAVAESAAPVPTPVPTQTQAPAPAPAPAAASAPAAADAPAAAPSKTSSKKGSKK